MFIRRAVPFLLNGEQYYDAIVDHVFHQHELERRVARLHAPAVERRAGIPDIPEAYCRQLNEEIHKHLGCAVRLTSGMTHANGKHVKGVLEIDFIDNTDLDRILALLGVKMD